MKRSFLMMSFLFSLFVILQSCRNAEEETEIDPIEPDVETQVDTREDIPSSTELENTDIVSSGTYTGTAVVVDDQQNEVYLQVNDTTKIELYFNNETTIYQNGQAVNFTELAKGQTLQVTVEKQGNSLKPMRVEILEK